MTYAKHVSRKATPQNQPIPGKSQVKNNAGGYVFHISDWDQLTRFLILGNAGGTYYCSEKQMTVENADVVVRCAKADLGRTLSELERCSYDAPKISPCLFALSLLTLDFNVTQLKETFLKVVRIGTHLTEFVENCKSLRGRGATFHKLVQSWYTSKNAMDLAYQVTKYQSRNGWCHRDILRVARPRFLNLESNNVVRYVVHPDKWEATSSLADTYLNVVETLKTAPLHQVVDLIVDHRLPREVVPTEHLNNPAVWEALLERMPMTAMIRNLGTMSKVGLLTPFSDASRKVVGILSDEVALQKAHIHPFSVLLALKTYGQGAGFRGSNTWTVDQQVLQALDDAFYKCFKYVKPTGKRFYLGIDCSGSMSGGGIAGSNVTPVEGAGVMAMATLRTEPFCYTAGFNGRMVPINLTKNMNLASVTKTILGTPWGSTDCALPMIDALEKKLPVDCFIVYTDNETWAGRIHPIQALKNYRDKMGINAKLIVCGMTATGFSIADPSDPGSLDIVGFDASVPSVINQFNT